MDRSFSPTEWKPQEPSGTSWPVSVPTTSVDPHVEHLADDVYMPQQTFSGALNRAAIHSGLEHYEIADRIHISHGYMCKFMHNVGAQWAKRLVAFMRVTKSLVPLQWIAAQMGCELVVRSVVSAELAAARAVIAEHERNTGRRLA